jgi:hypothetical protein
MAATAPFARIIFAAVLVFGLPGLPAEGQGCRDREGTVLKSTENSHGGLLSIKCFDAIPTRSLQFPRHFSVMVFWHLQNFACQIALLNFVALLDATSATWGLQTPTIQNPDTW